MSDHPAPLADHMEVGEVGRKTGMSGRFWKDKAKAGEVKGYRLGNRIVLQIESVNRFLEANRITRLELRANLRALHLYREEQA